MASDKVEFDDLFASDINKQLKELETGLKAVLETQKQLIKEGSKGGKSAENIERTNKALKESKTVRKSLTDVQKQQAQLQKQLSQSTDEEIRAKLRFAQATKEQKDELKDLLILENKEAGTLQKVAATSRKLRREREKLNLNTAKGKKRLQEINKELDKNNKKITENSDKLKQQKLNVGNYSDSIKEAANSSGLFGRQLGMLQRIQATVAALTKKNTAATVANATAQKAAGAASGGFTKALKILKVALISSGIGALVLVLGAVVSFFTNTQRGADKLSVVMAELGAVVDVLIDRLSGIGEAFSDLFSGDWSGFIDGISESFSGLGDEMKREALIARNLQRDLQGLARTEDEMIILRAKSARFIEKRRLAAKDENSTNAERVRNLDAAILSEEILLKAEVVLAKERARISQEQLDLGESTQDQINENAEVQAEYINLEAQSLKRLRTIQSERLSLIRKLRKEQEQRLFNDRKREIELIGDEEDKALAKELQRFNKVFKAAEKNKEDLELVEKVHQKKIDEIKAKFEKKAKDEKTKEDESAAELLKAEQDSLFSLEEFRLEIEIKRAKTIDDRVTKEIELAEKQAKQELLAEDLKANDITLIEEQLQQQILEIKKKALDDKQALIDDEVKANKKAEDEITAANLAAEKQRKADNKKLRDDTTSEFKKQLDNQFSDVNKANTEEISEAKKSIDTQQKLAEKGLDNQLAFEEQKLVEANAREQKELEKQAKIKESIILAEAYLAAYTARLAENPDTAPFKALQDVLLAKGISKTLIKAFEKGGLVEGEEQLIRINEKGQEFVLDAQTTKSMGLDKRGSSMGDFHNKMFSGQLFNHDFITSDMSKAQTYDNTRVVNAVESLENTIKAQPIQQVNVDGLGNLMEIIYKNGNKTKTTRKNPFK